jgi:hypothetical protein
VRVGTLLTPDALPPDVHIFTSTKQRWLTLPADARAFEIYYDRAVVWSEDARVRWRALLAG